MKKCYILFIGCLFIITGCLSMPDPVPDIYLVEKTNEEGKKLEKLEDAIIAKKKELDKAKKDYTAAKQKFRISKEKVSILEQEKTLLGDKEKLYTLEKNDKDLEDVKVKIKDNIQQLFKQNAYNDFCMTNQDNMKAMREIKAYELAVLVAELNYEKSKIAKVFLSKRESEPKDNEKKDSSILSIFSSNDKKIDDSNYKEFLYKQKEILEEKKQEQQKTADALKEAERKLKESGYEEKK